MFPGSVDPLPSPVAAPVPPADTAEALARLAATGDRLAWAWLVERHARRMHAAARAITGDAASADDAVQEALLAIARRAKRFQPRPEHGEEAAGAWIARAACHAALHQVRERRARHAREGRFAAQTQANEPPHQPDLELVRRELAALPERHREPLALHFLAGIGYERLAETLGISVATARVRVHRALGRLRDRLDGRPDAAGLMTMLADPGACPVPSAETLATWQSLALPPAAASTGVAAMLAKVGLAAAALVVAALAIVGNPPPPPDGIDEERRLNELAYRDEYVPLKVALEQTAAGRWVAIAGGRTLRDGDAIATFASLAEADAAAKRVAADAKHRFVFSVGSDGDVQGKLGDVGGRYLVGHEFQTYTLPGVVTGDPTRKPPLSWQTDAGTFIDLSCSDPAATVQVDEQFQFTDGLAAFAVIPPSFAADLGLERWEIPGRARLTGALQRDEHGRRANLQTSKHTLKPDRVEAVVIWSSEGHDRAPVSSTGNPRAIEPVDEAGLARLRTADLTAYRTQYLPEKARLERDAAGRWVVIQAGAILRAVDGEITTFPDALSAGDAADLLALMVHRRATSTDGATGEFPATLPAWAAHRYIFAIGSDGDAKQFLGGSGQRLVLSHAVMTDIDQLTINAARRTISVTRADGVVRTGGYVGGLGPQLCVTCADPGGRASTSAVFQLSSGYAGPALVTPSFAESLQLQRWEIPGTIRIEGMLAADDCRRATMRIRERDLGIDERVEVVIWSVDGQRRRLPKPVAPKAAR